MPRPKPLLTTTLPWTMLLTRTLLSRTALNPRVVPLHRVGPSHLAALVMTVIAVGTALAIATTTDPLWWQLHFSKLGTFNDFSGHVFNGTLIVAGLLILVFAVRVHADLVARHGLPRHRMRLFVTLVASVGVHLTIVGLIPVNANEFWHDRAASGLMLSFLGILVGTATTWRLVPRRLRQATAVVGLGLAGSIAAFIAGGLNLAGLEFIGFSLIFAWIGVFTRCLGRSPISRAEVMPSDDAASDDSAAPAAPRSPREAHRAHRIRRAPAMLRSQTLPVRPVRPPVLHPSVHRRPLSRDARLVVRAHRARGYRASGARSGSARSMTRDRR